MLQGIQKKINYTMKKMWWYACYIRIKCLKKIYDKLFKRDLCICVWQLQLTELINFFFVE